MKKFLIISLIVVFIILSMIWGINYRALKEIDTSKLDALEYTNYADDIGEGKVQLNWKYIAAITAVQSKNKIEQVTEEQIKQIGQAFVIKEDNGYKLKSLEDVLTQLNFNNREKKRVHTYLEQLEYFGIVPESVAKDSEQMNFINNIKASAIENYKKYGILPSITIAQAILESDFGRSDLAIKGSNLFGIKADANYSGEKIKFETKEFHDLVIEDDFRKYDNLNQSIDDHGKFLYSNERYKENGLFEAKTYIGQAKALEVAGYSTEEDENGEKIYSKKLIQLIKEYNLQLIDSQLKENS
ncbi:glycoside hydrolase family 73 protein [Clostridium senegalense]|uniref:glycoside hydrolase family 73 protein n=1 Tax=Clostridium senegalense TaxID=1465809 RepID=UPI00028A0681|nr:glucosaminidase domain-containing protein [Clostridium senegalense]